DASPASEDELSSAGSEDVDPGSGGSSKPVSLPSVVSEPKGCISPSKQASGSDRRQETRRSRCRGVIDCTCRPRPPAVAGQIGSSTGVRGRALLGWLGGRGSGIRGLVETGFATVGRVRA